MKLKKVKVLDGLEFGHVLQVSRSGRVMVLGGHTARAWDTRTWKVISEIDDLDEGDRGFREFDVTPDDKLLAAGSALRTTQIFDTRTGKRVSQPSKRKKDVWTAANFLKFSPDGSELACVKHSKLQVFRTGEWQTATRDYPLHPPQIADMAYTPDGKSIVTAAGTSIIIWSTTDAKKKMQLAGHKKLVQSIAIAPDGTFMATAAEDKTVILWKLPSGKKYAEYTGHEDLVFRVMLTPDGKTAASYDYKKEIHLWDTKTQKLLGKVISSEYEGMTFSPDGKLLVLPGFEVPRWPKLSQPLRIMDGRDGKQLATIDGGGNMAFAGGLMAVIHGRKVVLWELGK